MQLQYDKWLNLPSVWNIQSKICNFFHSDINQLSRGRSIFETAIRLLEENCLTLTKHTFWDWSGKTVFSTKRNCLEIYQKENLIPIFLSQLCGKNVPIIFLLLNNNYASERKQTNWSKFSNKHEKLSMSSKIRACFGVMHLKIGINSIFDFLSLRKSLIPLRILWRLNEDNCRITINRTTNQISYLNWPTGEYH